MKGNNTDMFTNDGTMKTVPYSDHSLTGQIFDAHAEMIKLQDKMLDMKSKKLQLMQA